MRVAAVIVAGGSGARMGGPVRKQYLELAGMPILQRAILCVSHPTRVHQVVVVLPPDDVAAPPRWLAEMGVTIVAGGPERGDSVWNGLTAVSRDIGYVLIHDGARPIVTVGTLYELLDSAPQAVIAAVPVTDTIHEVDETGTIVGTPDRARLWQAQTPQGFPLEGLLRAYRRARAEGFAGTDDAAVYARYEGPVRVVMGSYQNIKVTRREDLPVAEALALALSRGEIE